MNAIICPALSPQTSLGRRGFDGSLDPSLSSVLIHGYSSLSEFMPDIGEFIVLTVLSVHKV
jgi:hypothetical protein